MLAVMFPGNVCTAQHRGRWLFSLFCLSCCSKLLVPGFFLAANSKDKNGIDFAYVTVQSHNPMIGRPANNDKRELVIGRRSHGYVALYRYIGEIDTVFVLAVRSQKEAGNEEF